MIDFYLTPEIIIVKGTCQEEIQDLVFREEIAALALKRFLSEEISWQDYLDCLEVAGMNVDQYLGNVDQVFGELGF